MKTSVFKGKIGTGSDTSYFPIVTLEDESGWRMDLNSRFSEVVMNSGYGQLSLSMYISDEPRTYEELKEEWLYQLVGGLYVEKNKYDVVYSSYTTDTGYSTEIRIGNHDIEKILRDNIGKWVYIKIEAKNG